MKLEVGQFVRYKNGIGKIVGKYVKGVLVDKGIAGYFRIENEDIVKASNNIIDLIEVGDYVNGELVTSAEDVYTTDNIYIGREVIIKHSDVIIEEEIETIVTREQFSAMEYKID